MIIFRNRTPILISFRSTQTSEANLENTCPKYSSSETEFNNQLKTTELHLSHWLLRTSSSVFFLHLPSINPNLFLASRANFIALDHTL
uniref:Uncharacterized protein n=1 Tax=Helianthus annuus TaxID=4232 RepID=A0A251SZA9_HELAN